MLYFLLALVLRFVRKGRGKEDGRVERRGRRTDLAYPHYIQASSISVTSIIHWMHLGCGAVYDSSNKQPPPFDMSKKKNKNHRPKSVINSI